MDSRLDVLPGPVWRDRAAAHRDRVDALLGPYLRRRAAGTKHPVIDFLFTYYGRHGPNSVPLRPKTSRYQLERRSGSTRQFPLNPVVSC